MTTTMTRPVRQSMIANILLGAALLVALALAPRLTSAQDTPPVTCGTPADNPAAVEASGAGDQIVEFSISEPGLYRLTLVVEGDGGSMTFATVSVRAMPETNWTGFMSVLADAPGSFSTAEELVAGDYYFETLGDPWELTLTPMG